MNKQIIPGCVCSKRDEDSGRYICSVSGDQCMFMIPDAVACARRFGEGPLADLEIMSDQSLAIERLQEDVLDLTADNARLTARCAALERAISSKCSTKQHTCRKWVPLCGCERHRTYGKGPNTMPWTCKECPEWEVDEARFTAKEGKTDA